jgi:hypothetical protein
MYQLGFERPGGGGAHGQWHAEFLPQWILPAWRVQVMDKVIRAEWTHQFIHLPQSYCVAMGSIEYYQGNPVA